jgi:hypothetical protein
VSTIYRVYPFNIYQNSKLYILSPDLPFFFRKLLTRALLWLHRIVYKIKKSFGTFLILDLLGDRAEAKTGFEGKAPDGKFFGRVGG